MKSGKIRNAFRAGAVLIAIMLLGGLLVSSPQAAQPWKVSTVSLLGADGANNNMAFAYDRYILVAPYAPSKVPTDPAAVDQLDNYNISLIDSKRPATENVLSHALETISDHHRLYYPTKVVYDEDSKTVYVRGTRYEAVEGGVQEIAVIAYMRLNLDDNGKPVFDDNVVMIDIAGAVDERIASDAPDDMALAYNGNVLVFTNGASIFTYNLSHGYLYNVDIVEPKAYNAGSRITYLDVDEATNTLKVYWNNQVGEGSNLKNRTELSFYNLDKNGTMQLNKRLHSEQFPAGVYITAGSNIEIIGDAENRPSSAMLVTSDGMLSQIDLTGEEIFAALKPIYLFDKMAVSGTESGPRMVKYDAAKRTVGVVKQGYTAQIRKPSNGHGSKPGSVIRALSMFNAVESPALAVARLNKNLTKVVASKLYTQEFRDEAGLTPLVDGKDSQWLLASWSGNVVSVSTSGSIDTAALNSLTQVGPRTSRIAYFSSRDSVVAINSFSLDATEQSISEPGALVLARPSAVSSQAFGTASAATLPARHVVKSHGSTPSIRRPCNIHKQ
ncbi:MAG: hypothetical protein ACJ74G_24490 [Blastocatellia bacterium]